MTPTSLGLPRSMMPREKILNDGPHALTDVELVALFLRTGVEGKNVFQMANELLLHFRGLAGLVRASASDLARVKGMKGDAKRAQLIGVLEMARRAMVQELRTQPIMNSPRTVKEYLQIELGALPYETFSVMFLDNQNRLLQFVPMFRGSISQTMVYPREIAKIALELGANGVILAHNHPSGHVEPSRSDQDLTQHLQNALRLIDVHVRDHIIVSQGQSFSMAEAGLL